MFFYPLRADLVHHRFPLVTLIVSLLCLGIHYGQSRNEEAFYAASHAFCDQATTAIWRLVLEQISETCKPMSCTRLMWRLDRTHGSQTEMAALAARGPNLAGYDHEQSAAYRFDVIADHYTRFRTAVPVNQTWRLHYEPHSWNLWAMITASLAHADWWHVTGNLFFFVAFAVTVETILGSLLMAGMMAVLAVATHVFYSLSVAPVLDAPATLGLSGVVMGVMGLFAFFTPGVRILCFVWFYIGYRIISIPAWMLVLGFSAWDLYNLFSSAVETSNVNFVSHVSGAGVGYLLGVLFFQARRSAVYAEVFPERAAARRTGRTMASRRRSPSRT